MPRSTISFEPVDPNTPVQNGLSNALAAIVQGFARRRELQDAAQERQYQHQRQESNDQLRLEEIISARRNRDQQLELQRAGLQDRRDERALADERLNEDRDYHNQDLNQKQIMAMNLLDEKKAEAAAKEGKGKVAFKDARRLALAQARSESGRDGFGNPKPIDPKRVDQLTKQFMDGGDEDEPLLPSGKAPPEASVLDQDLLNPVVPPPAVPPPAAAPAEAEPGLGQRWWEATKEGASAISDLFTGGADAPAPAMQVTPGYMDPFGLQYRVNHADAPAAAPAAAAPAAPVVPSAQPDASMGDDEGVDAAVPEPDPQHLDSMEALAVGNPQSFVKVMKTLKAQRPAEYMAVDRALRARRQRKGQNAAP